ncbi:MAG: hypothetical protein R3E66_09635 [bacterium]
MSRLSRIFATATFVFLSSMVTPAFAQRSGMERIEEVAAEIGVTETQRAQIKRVIQAKKAKADAIKADKKLTYDQKSDKLKALRKEGRDEIGKILTPEQREALRNRMEKRRDRFQEVVKSLELTDAQRAKAREILEDAGDERDMILEATNGDRRAARKELKAHREKTAQKLRAILNPAQQKKFDAAKRDMQDGPGPR